MASTVTSLVSLAIIVLLTTAGLIGSRDPLANPLPLFVWTVWWIGFTYLHAIFGNLWAHVNPWIGLYHLLTAARRLRRRREHPPLQYPPWAGHWPAVAGFLAFAWFELIHPAPADPAVLASLVASYFLFHLAGVLAFGVRWLQEAEPFSVFFGMVSSLAPLGMRDADRSAPEPRGAARGRADVPRPQATPDGGAAGEPGRLRPARARRRCRSTGCRARSRGSGCSARTRSRTLAAPFSWSRTRSDSSASSSDWSLAYVAAVRLLAAAGRHRVSHAPGSSHSSRSRSSPSPAATTSRTTCRCSWWTCSTRSGPHPTPSRGGGTSWGRATFPCVTSFLSDPERVYAIWHSQVAIIVGAHVAGVVIAHALALRLAAQAPATVSQLPMLLLMIGYTTLGLWLLSTPAVG